MTDYYVDSATGDNGDTGGVGDPFLTYDYAVTQAGTDDRIVLEYASGTAYVLSSLLTLGAGVARLVTTGRDSAGVIAADSPATFNRAEQAVVEVNFSGSGIQQTHADLMQFHGIYFDGKITADEAYFSTTSTAQVLFQLCEVRSFLVRGLRFRVGTMRESKIYNCTEGVEFLENGQVFESCQFLFMTNLAIDKFSNSLTATMTNCTVYRCGGTTYPIDTDVSGTGWTLTNNLFVDNTSQYGLPDSIQTTGNCYASSGSYHTIANYNGTADPTDDLELDPTFDDAGAFDFHLGNATLRSGGTATAVTRLYDGADITTPPPVGSLGLGSFEFVSVTPVDAVTLDVAFNAAYDPTTTVPATWEFGFQTAVAGYGLLPKVISQTTVNTTTVRLTLSAPGMSGGTAYTLTSTAESL